jgi:hypothetical protein
MNKDKDKDKDKDNNDHESLIRKGLFVLALLAFIGAGVRVFGSQEEILKRLDEKTLLYISVSAILLRFREVTSFKFAGSEVEFREQITADIKKDLKEDIDISTRAAEANIYGVGRAPNQKQSLLEEEIKPGNVADDPWKGQFDGKSSNNNRKLTATVVPVSNLSEYFYIKLRVESTDNNQLKGIVKFYIHPTFIRNKVIVPAINGIAEINLQACGAFTVGAITEDGTKLELDLAEFKDPSLSLFVSR